MAAIARLDARRADRPRPRHLRRALTAPRRRWADSRAADMAGTFGPSTRGPSAEGSTGTSRLGSPRSTRSPATAFVVGGSLFAIGAALAQGDVGGPLLAASVYLAGGVFFCSGGYASVLLVTNLPHRRRDGATRSRPGAGGRRSRAAGVAQRRRPLRRHPRLRDQPRRLVHRRTDPGPGGPPDLVAGHGRLRPLPRLRPPGDGRDLRPLVALLAPRTTSAGGSSSSTSSARSSSWSPPSPPSSTATATWSPPASPTGAR